MTQDETALPEGTDKVVQGAGVGASDAREQEAVGRSSSAAVVAQEPEPDRGEEATSARDRIREQLRSGGEKLSSQAAEKTRGLVAQGIERSSDALGNISRLVGDTAPGLDERLGPEYGDYARKAADAIDRAAQNLAKKDADELIDDVRHFVQQSPGVALAGAAIAGFALVRLLKSGLEESGSGRKSDKSPKA